ncbi:hypothetical protein SDC9_41617 [bioreactor metagenome]|uniref:Uncharacterized protein n=1 Tax=bioreactor metagenome TaxID=1076179 RepID=A0A644VVV2_9ZZZZ
MPEQVSAQRCQKIPDDNGHSPEKPPEEHTPRSRLFHHGTVETEPHHVESRGHEHLPRRGEAFEEAREGKHRCGGRREKKEDDEEGHRELSLFSLPEGEDKDDGGDPQGPGELHDGGRGEGRVPEKGGGPHHGTRVVDAEGAPDAVLFRRKRDYFGQQRKGEEGHGVEQKDHAHGDPDLFVPGLHHRGDGGYGAAAADGGTEGDEFHGIPVEAEEPEQEIPQRDDHAEAHRRLPESLPAHGDHLPDVQAETEEDHRSVEGELPHFPEAGRSRRRYGVAHRRAEKQGNAHRPGFRGGQEGQSHHDGEKEKKRDVRSFQFQK